jgi:hypothetical protein
MNAATFVIAAMVLVPVLLLVADLARGRGPQNREP